MAKTKQSFRARVTQATGRRKQPAKKTNPVQRAFDDVKQLVSDTGGRVFSRSGKSGAATKQTSSKKTASTSKKTASARKRSSQQRQAATKKAGAARIRRGQQRQAAAKKAARTRGVKTS